MKGGDEMRYAVLGGDMRFAHLVSMLNESGRESAGFFQEKAGGESLSPERLKKYSCIISNWPMKRPLGETELMDVDIMEHIAPGSILLLCGPGFPGERRWDLQYINLWEDEKLLRENAWLTAEAAAAVAMRRIKGDMRARQCAVVGYGRIGQALTQILLNMGAQVTVVSGKEGKRDDARECGAQALPTELIASALPGRQLVFSTPPAMVLDHGTLQYAGKETIFIDLASPPYGVNLEAAHELGLQAFREPGLPGRYCPMSAARAIYNAVLRWEEMDKHE